MDQFTEAYLECVEFTECHSDNPELDGADFSPEFIASVEADCADFQESNADLLEEAYQANGYDETRAGHDFWLTRNGHGAGFWDRGLGDVGARLTAAAKVYSGVDLYAGDDGLIYGA